MKTQARAQRRDVFDQALALGATGLQARLLAGRLAESAIANLDWILNPHLRHLASPDQLADIQPALDRLVQAIQGDE